MNERFWNVDTAFGIQPGDALVPKYLFFFCKSFNFKSLDKSTTIPSLTKRDLLKIEMPVPSIQEQERIVTRIEELLSKLDNAMEMLKKVRQQLAVYRQAVLKEAFSVCSTTVHLKSVCEHITDGDHMPPPKSVNGIPFIMISNIKNNRIDWTNTAHVGSEYFNRIDERRKPMKGDILYTVTGSFGIPVMVDFEREFCFQRHIALLRPKDCINQQFLYYALQTPEVYMQSSKKATGTAQKTVGLGVLRNLEIPFESELKCQKLIVAKLISRLSVCEDVERTIDSALQQSEEMRQSILKQAFEGNFGGEEESHV